MSLALRTRLAHRAGRLLAAAASCSQYPIRAVGPLALLLVLHRCYTRPGAIWRLLRQAGRLWLSLEALGLLFYFWQARRLSARAKPPPMRGDKLTELRRCLAATDEIARSIEVSGRAAEGASLEEALRRGGTGAPARFSEAQMTALKRSELGLWFMGEPTSGLRRGNLEEWLAWAFWDGTPEEIAGGSERALLDRMVDETARWASLWPLPKVQSVYRPLAFYAVTQLSVMACTSVAMAWLGFERHCAGSLRYWRRGSDSLREPLVFCHGLGVGILPYLPLLSQLIGSGRVGSIFCVELPHISMRMKRQVPSASELVSNIEDMLAAWHVQSAHFMGHSFGSVVVSWMTKRSRSLISRATFLDPVVFLLCKADVAYNFVYREPRNGLESCMQYFVARELYIAHSLGRHFIWHECILWPDDLSYPQGALVLLSGRDSIIPAHTVRQYLESHRVDVCFLPEFEHAQFLLYPTEREALIERAFA